MATRHTYASADNLRDYLAGTNYSSSWTSDAGIISRIVEASSRLIDNFVGMQSFGPRTETRYYDIGSGSLRNSPQNVIDTTNNTNIGLSSAYVSAVVLDAWLISTSSVTSYKSTDRSASEALTEGYDNDYWLMPYNSTPKVELKLNEDTSKSFHGGQQTLAIAGSWGYTNDTTPQKTTADAISSTTTTSVSVTSAADLSPAQTVLIDSEQLYITSISGNTLTVERGVNGTTAATHSGGASVYLYAYPELVIQVCLDLGKIAFRDRDLGVTQTLGSGDIQITRADSEVWSTLKMLQPYKAVTNTSEVYF
jgi:hypothetical protein